MNMSPRTKTRSPKQHDKDSMSMDVVRAAWIECILATGESVEWKKVKEKFKCSQVCASESISVYMQLNPESVKYDFSRKKLDPTKNFKRVVVAGVDEKLVTQVIDLMEKSAGIVKEMAKAKRTIGVKKLKVLQ